MTDAKKSKKDNSQLVLYFQRVQLSRVPPEGPVGVKMALMALNTYCMMTLRDIFVVNLSGNITTVLPYSYLVTVLSCRAWTPN